jgi:prepilin-type processing-associated H-X9-DG protein
MPTMKKISSSQLARCLRQSGIRAFTLTELLVVIGSLALLSAALLSVAFTTQERVLRAQCTDNLRQIGVGWNIYQQEFNQVMPCYWPGVTTNLTSGLANPWVTSEVYRIDSGNPLLIGGDQGPWNLGVLFASQLIPNPKLFYCPSLARLANIYTYDYYATGINGWPSAPAGTSAPYIRTGYNYYPQLRATEYAGGGQYRPKAAVTPTKWTALDTRKSIVTDLVYSYDTLAHRASGSVAGLNALFPDGHVTFQNARSNPQDFDPLQWGQAGAQSSIGQNPNYFRYVMSLWQP